MSFKRVYDFHKKKKTINRLITETEDAECFPCKILPMTSTYGQDNFSVKTLRAGNEESSKVETSATTVTGMYWAEGKLNKHIHYFTKVALCSCFNSWMRKQLFVSYQLLLSASDAPTQSATHRGTIFRWQNLPNLCNLLCFQTIFFILNLIIISKDGSTYLKPELLAWGWDPWSSMTKVIGLTKSLGLVKHKQKVQFIFSDGLHSKCSKALDQPAAFKWYKRANTEVWANPTWCHPFFSLMNCSFFPFLTGIMYFFYYDCKKYLPSISYQKSSWFSKQLSVSISLQKVTFV